MVPRYRVALEAAEREELLALTRNGKTPSRVFVSARALLLCDQGPHGPAWTVATTAEALGVTARTIEHISGASPSWGWRQRCGARPGSASGGR